LPSSRRYCQRLLLGLPEPEQLEQVVHGGDQVPLAVHLLQTPEQEATDASALLDLAAFTGSTIAYSFGEAFG
jgi:hypothetical protein